MTESQPAAQIADVSSLTEGLRRTLLAARGLHKAFGGQVVLDGVDIQLREGEVVLLRGENGSGKTTLLNILTGNLEPDSGAIEYSADDSPRAYSFPRRWWQELNPWDHFRPEFVATEGLGRTWQDIRLFRAQTLRDNIAAAMPRQPGENPALTLFAPRRVRRTEQQIRQKADAMLARLGLAGRETASADKISLGQSKRVAIARAVAAGARILFLDEPLAGLDQPGIRNVLDLLESIVRDHSVTLVIVEHVFNLPQLAYLATSDWLLKEGKLECTRTAPVPEQGAEMPVVKQGVQTRPEWFDLLTDHGTEITDEPLPRGAILTRVRSSERNGENRKPVLEIRDLIVQRGSRVVIGLDDQRDASGFNLTLFEGELAVLHAPNGWGKSTLMAAIMGLVPSVAGEIFLEAADLAGAQPWERVRRGLRSLPSGNTTFPNLCPTEALRLSGKPVVPKEIESISGRVCSSLSGGEKQRVALSCFSEGRVTILDEPWLGLDSSGVNSIISRLILNKKPAESVLILAPNNVDEG